VAACQPRSRVATRRYLNLHFQEGCAVALFTREHFVSSNRIYEGHIVNLRVDQLKLPDGHEVLRELVEHNGGVVIIAQPKPESIILIRQYRYSVDEELLEFPAGRVEKGEDPFVCAKRELIEETGYQAANWEPFAEFFTAPGFCNEILRMYRATDLTFVGKSLDHDEETDAFEIEIAEAWKLVKQGKVRDAKTVAGLGLLFN
jgi:ADP-ribose pyrophosphatase